MLKQFFSRNLHWLLLIIIAIGFFTGLLNYTYSTQDIVAIAFGAIGLLGVTYFAFHVEIQKRKKGG